ncbi:MAG TPA: helix-turn-helix domain-containing protein [Candidatus Limnocylindrales bacterium]|jgi:transcriptional regulator with XRE-family HTH domain|nr:helix-turn-helix domain-containing protein [Candidatus Limnocylindrales bacterium]
MSHARGSRSRTRHARLTVAGYVSGLRRTIGWSQAELAQRAGLSQAWVSEIETGKVDGLTFESAALVLEALGARLVIGVDAPFLGDRERQRDTGHVRCVAHVSRRLERAGWAAVREVEVGIERSRGWIDLLAFHGETGVLLVIEIKTEIHDLGAIERSLGWYEREAWAAARRMGWRPRAVIGCLLLLATATNDERVRANRASLQQAFKLRATDLTRLLSVPVVAHPRAERGVAMIDPTSRRKRWLMALAVDGRRSRPAFVDYADFISASSRRGNNRSGRSNEGGHRGMAGRSSDR